MLTVMIKCFRGALRQQREAGGGHPRQCTVAVQQALHDCLGAGAGWQGEQALRAAFTTELWIGQECWG